MAQQKYFLVDKFVGGISDGSKVGIVGSFYSGRSIDYRSDPDVLQTNYAATKNSGTIDTDLITWIQPVNSDVYFLGNTGKFYSKTGGTGTFSLVGTVSLCAGNGMEFFNDYVYIAGGTKAARYGPISGTAALTDPYATFISVQSETWHPMANFINYLCMGNGRYLSTFDGTIYTYNQLTLPPGYHIRSLCPITGKFLAIGTYQGDSINAVGNSKIFLWDGSATTYNDIIEINEGGINAMTFHQNNLYIWAGIHGNMYAWNGNLVKLKRVPQVGVGKYVEIYPGAVTVQNGVPYFAVSNGDSTTVFRGVYSYGQVNKNYPNSLNFDYPISTGTYQGTAVVVGAIKGISPSQFYIGWQDTAGTIGVDQISTSSYYTTSRFETLVFDDKQPYKQKYTTIVKASFKPLAAGESVAVEYKLDDAASWTALGTASYTSDGAITEKRFTVDWRYKDAQMAVAMAGSGTTAPKITSVGMYFSTEDWL